MVSVFVVLAVGLIAVTGLLLLVTLAEAAMGALVLGRGGGQRTARLLGTYLILQPFAFGIPLLTIGAEGPDFRFDPILEAVSPAWAGVFMLVAVVCMGMLPAILVAFALNYPHPSAGPIRQVLWLVLPFLPSAAILAWAVVAFATSTQPRAPLEQTLVYAGAYQFLGTAAAGVIFWARSRRASTQLERRRLLYMVRVIAAPLAGGMLGLFLLLTLASAPLRSEIAFLLAVVFLELIIVAVVLVPAIGMAFGLLRYKILDLEKRVRSGFRFTVGSGFMAFVYAFMFFAASEGAETLIETQTDSRWFGLGGALLLTFAFQPLRRVAKRVASRVVPHVPESPQAREERRRIAYRATYEELSADRRLSSREQRTLAALAHSLGLTAADADSIRWAVEQERSKPGYARPT